jgi:hypothetical protein
MVGVPYLSLGVVGFLIYRGCKKNAEYRRRLDEPGDGWPEDGGGPA